MSRREDLDNAIWSDPDFAELTGPAKLLYIWSFTNQRCGMSGLYKVSRGAMVFEISHPLPVIEAALVELEEARFLHYDGAVLWVRSRVKHIRTKTKQIAVSIANDVVKLHPHPYTEWFLQAYSSLQWLRDAFTEAAQKHGDYLNLSEVRPNLLGKGSSGSSEEKTTATATSKLDAPALARKAFVYWQEKCGHPNAQPTPERLGKVRARLAQGYSLDAIRSAIDGAATAAFVNEQGKRFDDLELICRNGGKLEDFMGRASSKPAGAPPMPISGEEYAQKMAAKSKRESARQLASLSVEERAEFERRLAASRGAA